MKFYVVAIKLKIIKIQKIQFLNQLINASFAELLETFLCHRKCQKFIYVLEVINISHTFVQNSLICSQLPFDCRGGQRFIQLSTLRIVDPGKDLLLY